MSLVDTSVWVDFLRGTDSRAAQHLRRMLAQREEITATEPIVMELLAGATNDRALAQIEMLTDGLPIVGVDPRLDYRDAAAIFRTVRRSGKTVRRLNDCLIAAVALRHDIAVVHKDADFEAIAKATPLRTVALTGESVVRDGKEDIT